MASARAFERAAATAAVRRAAARAGGRVRRRRRRRRRRRSLSGGFGLRRRRRPWSRRRSAFYCGRDRLRRRRGAPCGCRLTPRAWRGTRRRRCRHEDVDRRSAHELHGNRRTDRCHRQGQLAFGASAHRRGRASDRKEAGEHCAYCEERDRQGHRPPLAYPGRHAAWTAWAAGAAPAPFDAKRVHDGHAIGWGFPDPRQASTRTGRRCRRIAKRVYLPISPSFDIRISRTTPAGRERSNRRNAI
jgi:hypothetical protein